MRRFNRTKIIATVGPASNTYSKIVQLMEAGVDVFRLNFSHGTHAEHEKVIRYIQRANKKYKVQVGILADLQGPKIRVGEVEKGTTLAKGDVITITNKECVSNNKMLYINYEALPQEVEVGQKILLDDGKIELEVQSTNGEDTLQAIVLHGGILTSRKGVNLPNARLSVPAVTEKDKRDLEFALRMKANWIAVSFVRSAEDIAEVRKYIPDRDAVKVIAKIEKPEALDHINEIISEADAIMIARGDLGVEVPMEKMPIIQKSIVRRCITASKPVVIATQIMDSMVNQARPTRAEVNDVANDMIDGADALLLSNETSVGRHPVLVVQTLEKIMKYVESKEVVYNKNLIPQRTSKTFLSDAVCYNACKIAEEVGAAAIVGMTRSGYTAFMLSSYRPHAKIMIFTDNKDLLNILSLSWGVSAFYYNKFKSTDSTISDVIDILKKNDFVKPGDIVVNTGTMPLHKRGRTNMLKVTVVE
ncbi:MAG: pyruvate kinase [Chitinophagales bacterium]|nr:MAG: pyruvate kinase [Chitinophagales bacterium]